MPALPAGEPASARASAVGACSIAAETVPETPCCLGLAMMTRRPPLSDVWPAPNERAEWPGKITRMCLMAVRAKLKVSCPNSSASALQKEEARYKGVETQSKGQMNE